MRKEIGVLTVVFLSLAALTALAADAPVAAPGMPPAAQAEPVPLPPGMTEAQVQSYSIGAQIATQFKPLASDLDRDQFFKGFTDVLDGKPSVVTDEQKKQALMNFQRTAMAKMQEEQKKAAEKNLSEQKEFLDANAKKEGVKALPSGLQYKVVAEGAGASPSVTDRVKVHYKGTLPNGKVFDSSIERGQPAEFQINKTIKGWQEALPMMKVGAKWELYVPSDLAYGTMGRPRSIEPNQMLIFEIELLEILPPATEVPATPAMPGNPPAMPPSAPKGSS